MIDSLEVANFRCYESLALHGLRRMNIVVGENASGKTALLESVFLTAGGSPELVLRLRAWRGLGDFGTIPGDRTSYESLWKDLFWGFDQSRTITGQLVGSHANTRAVRIAYQGEPIATLPFTKGGSESPLIVPITFEWKDAKGNISTSEVRITREGLKLGGNVEIVPAYFFSSAILPNPTENAGRFSELSKQGRQEGVIAALKKQFPYIENISIEINAGITMLYASVRHLSQKVPVGMLSAGINKLLSLLLATAEKAQGVILVDEIENGFYHKLMPGVWSALLDSTRRHNTQLFATTHSAECLEAMLPSVKGAEDDFCLIRTERHNGQTKVVLFSGRQLEDAIHQRVDVR